MTSLLASRVCRFVATFHAAGRETLTTVQLARHSVRRSAILQAESDGVLERVPGQAFAYRLARNVP